MIKIKLRLDDNPYEDTAEYLLYARGIQEPKHYKNVTENDLIDFNELDNVDKAINVIDMLIKSNKKNWVILVDCDADGYVSSSSLYRYIKRQYDIDCKYILHIGKEHGLGDTYAFEKIKSLNPDLVIIPDAGTNDILECMELLQMGSEVIVLDHHEKETVSNNITVVAPPNVEINFEGGAIYENNPAIVINPHVCNYSNKSLSGGAVVWKFIQALDDFNETNYERDYRDMTALSIVSDSMSLKSYENRYIVVNGLRNIKHPLFKAFIKQQARSLNDKEDVNAIDCSFYIVPLINATIRIGSDEEKELMFRAFCCLYEEFDYQKRGKTEIVKEDIYTRVSRLCYNAKSRQAKIRDKDTNFIIDTVKNCGLDKNEFIFVDGCNQLNKSLTGLTAMRVSNYFNKPVLVGNITDEDGHEYLSGSVRSVSTIENFKDLLSSTKMFSMLVGHQGACGFTIDVDKAPTMIKKMNKTLKELNIDNDYIIVDSILEDEEIDTILVNEVNNFSDYVGNDIKEVVFYIPDIEVCSDNMEIIGKDKNTIKWKNENEVTYIVFNQSNDSKLLQIAQSRESDNSTKAYVDVIGVMKINTYNAVTEPQIVINKLYVHDNLTITKKDDLIDNDLKYIDLDDDIDDWG